MSDENPYQSPRAPAARSERPAGPFLFWPRIFMTFMSSAFAILWAVIGSANIVEMLDYPSFPGKPYRIIGTIAVTFGLACAASIASAVQWYRDRDRPALILVLSGLAMALALFAAFALGLL